MSSRQRRLASGLAGFQHASVLSMSSRVVPTPMTATGAVVVPPVLPRVVAPAPNRDEATTFASDGTGVAAERCTRFGEPQNTATKRVVAQEQSEALDQKRKRSESAAVAEKAAAEPSPPAMSADDIAWNSYGLDERRSFNYDTSRRQLAFLLNDDAADDNGDRRRPQAPQGAGDNSP